MSPEAVRALRLIGLWKRRSAFIADERLSPAEVAYLPRNFDPSRIPDFDPDSPRVETFAFPEPAHVLVEPRL